MAKDKKTATASASEDGPTKADVFAVNKGGVKTYVRTYSLQEHGEHFLKLAEQYAGKIQGEVRKG